MRIFLSLGFSGRTKEEVMKDIEDAKEIIQNFHPDDNLEFIHNYDYEGVNRVECLGEAIKKMATCDIVYFINNWHLYKGCVLERTLCKVYNLNYATINTAILENS